MSQTLNQRLTLSKFYSHDPKHFRFSRSLESFQPIEDCGSGDKWVGWVSVVIALMLIFI